MNEATLERPHVEQSEAEGLSRVDKLKAKVYEAAREYIPVGESPYEDALAIKAGETAMTAAEKAGRKIAEKFRNRTQPPMRNIPQTY